MPAIFVCGAKSRQLNNTSSGTSSNSNGVDLLGISISDPPTQEVQDLLNKVDELINALRREGD